MAFIKTSLLSTCAVALALLGSGVSAPVQAAESDKATKLPFNEDQRAAMEDFVRNFILDNPEVLMESVNRYRAEEAKKKEADSVKVLKENMSYINNGKHPVIGNPKGDVTIVEFFDYNCGYCKKALPVVQKLVENDKNIRVIFLDLPILSPQSAVAAKWAVAANKQGKYWEFHQALLENNGPKDDENLAKIAKAAGLDVERLQKDAAGRDVQTYLDGVMDFSKKMNVSGTPAFVVGEQILRGYTDYDSFKSMVDDARKTSK